MSLFHLYCVRPHKVLWIIARVVWRCDDTWSKESFKLNWCSPSLPQPSAGQGGANCQSPVPVFESGTQERGSQSEFEWQWSKQQQWSPTKPYLQLLDPRLVQGLPGNARLHSDLISWVSKSEEHDGDDGNYKRRWWISNGDIFRGMSNKKICCQRRGRPRLLLLLLDCLFTSSRQLCKSKEKWSKATNVDKNWQNLTVDNYGKSQQKLSELPMTLFVATCSWKSANHDKNTLSAVAKNMSDLLQTYLKTR